jgi:hypothetical protein
MVSVPIFWVKAYFVVPSNNSLILLRDLRGEMLFLGLIYRSHAPALPNATPERH